MIDALDHSPQDDLVTYLRAAGADQYGHGQSRSLFDHLAGTRDILARWHQPEYLQLAGLLHSVYGTDRYLPRLLTTSQREEVRRLAGERAERLAYLFGVVPRPQLFAELEHWPDHSRAIRTGGGGDERPGEEITRQEAEELVLLHIANLAEQARGPSGPGEWLARVGRLGRLLGESGLTVPPVLAALSPITADNEVLARRAYVLALEEMADVPAAQRHLAQALAVCPVLPDPYVWLAWTSAGVEDWAAAEWWAQTAGARLTDLATTWDKRLSYEECSMLVDGIGDWVRSRRPPVGASPHTPKRLLKAVQGGQQSAGPASPTANGGRATHLSELGRERFHRYISTFAERTGDVRRRHYPGLESRPFHDPVDFPLVAYLEENSSAIKTEVLALEANAFHPEAETIERRGNWDVVFFYDRGRRIEETCEACPTVTYAIDHFPTMRTITGLIYISRLSAGTHIAAHRGRTNFRLRCHLGIVVPEGDCAIRNGGETRSWQEGRCLVLDDHFEHEAWNHTASDRIVIVMDVWHPGLTETEVELLKGLHRYAYSYAERQHGWWQAHYRSPAAG